MLELKIEELTQVPWRLATDRAHSSVENVGCIGKINERITRSQDRRPLVGAQSSTPACEAAKSLGAFRSDVIKEIEK